MNKTAKTIIAIASVVLIFVLLIVVTRLKKQGNAVPKNPANLAGNIYGNLYNQGLFTEDDKRVYFANPYDGYNLYSMNPDQTDIKRVAGGCDSMLNIAGDYIYYYSSTSGDQGGLGYVRNGKGLFRTKINGDKTFTMAKGTSDSMILIGNYVLYSLFSEKDGAANVTIHKTTTSNTDDCEVIDQHAVLGSAYEGELYYAGVTGDHYIYAYDPVNDKTRLVAEINAYMPIVSGGKIFYLDLDDEYSLKSYSLFDGAITTIVDDRIDSYNMYESSIFYQTSGKDNYALWRVNTDGTGTSLIMNGVFKNINVTSTYTYFTDFGNDYPIYQVSTFGGTSVSTFDGASAAVREKMN